MIDGRKRAAIAALCIAALGGSALVAAPTFADPNIDDVQARVDQLYRQAEQASERYNTARLDLHKARARLRTLRADLDRQKRSVSHLREEVAATVVAQSQGLALSSAAQVILSRNPDAFLDRLVTVSQYDEQRDRLIADFAARANWLAVRKAAARRTMTDIKRTKRQLAAEKAQIDEKAGEAKALLERLKSKAAERAAARRAAARRPAARAAARAQDPSPSASSSPSLRPTSAATSSPTTSAPSVSGGAAAAVDYALAQVGDAYVYGADGPDVFDCSGLTMMAWRQAGISLPHSSSEQMNYGTPVSSSNLRPGDLVFYHSPVSHVGIYIGNGRIVHAANPTDGVLTAPVFSMPYSGAVRPG